LPPAPEEDLSSPDEEQASTSANSPHTEVNTTEQPATTPDQSHTSAGADEANQASEADTLTKALETTLANVESNAASATASKTSDPSTTQQAPAAQIPPPPPTPLHDPVPIFAQAFGTSRSNSTRNMAFTGYHRIIRIARLAPHSPELIKMLEQKWEPPKSKWGTFMNIPKLHRVLIFVLVVLELHMRGPTSPNLIRISTSSHKGVYKSGCYNARP